MDKKHIGCDLKSDEILTIFFREGLRVFKRKRKKKLSDEEAIVLLYLYMRPFEEYDYKNNSGNVMKTFADDNDELFKDFYGDMSHVTHGTYKEEERIAIENRNIVSFKTSMPFKGAFRIFVALACNVLGKNLVANIMKSKKIKFEKYGDEEAVSRYKEKCKKKNFDIIAQRNK